MNIVFSILLGIFSFRANSLFKLKVESLLLPLICMVSLDLRLIRDLSLCSEEVDDLFEIEDCALLSST